MSFQSLTMPCSMGYRMESSPRCSWGQRAGHTVAASLSTGLPGGTCSSRTGSSHPAGLGVPRTGLRVGTHSPSLQLCAANCAPCPISRQSRRLLLFHGPLGTPRANDRRHPPHCLAPGHNLLAPTSGLQHLEPRLATMMIVLLLEDA